MLTESDQPGPYYGRITTHTSSSTPLHLLNRHHPNSLHHLTQ